MICPDGACEHGGLCVAVNHRPKCFCPAGFTGARCEVNVDECASNPCHNGAECVDLPQGYRCDCPPTFSGLQCQGGPNSIESQQSFQCYCPSILWTFQHSFQ